MRALREARGWTQGALADRLGVSRQTVNAIETGRYDPGLPLAFRLSALFERRIEAIFHPADEAPSPQPRAERRPPSASSAPWQGPGGAASEEEDFH